MTDPRAYHRELLEKNLEDPVFAAEYWKTRFELEHTRAEEQHRQNKANSEAFKLAMNGQKRLRGILDDYGSHKGNCNFVQPMGICDCGWDDIRKQLKLEQSE